MTTQEQKALELALEALEQRYPFTVSIPKAITAIKEALNREAMDSSPNGEAQPEQRSVSEDINLSCKSTQARLAASWGYVKAEPLTDEWEKAYDLGWQAGFCAPPHKPLTDAQIEKVLGDFPYYSNEWEENEHKRFARSIEAAHGIKE